MFKKEDIIELLNAKVDTIDDILGDRPDQLTAIMKRRKLDYIDRLDEFMTEMLSLLLLHDLEEKRDPITLTKFYIRMMGYIDTPWPKEDLTQVPGVWDKDDEEEKLIWSDISSDDLLGMTNVGDLVRALKQEIPHSRVLDAWFLLFQHKGRRTCAMNLISWNLPLEYVYMDIGSSLKDNMSVLSKKREVLRHITKFLNMKNPTSPMTLTTNTAAKCVANLFSHFDMKTLCISLGSNESKLNKQRNSAPIDVLNLAFVPLTAYRFRKSKGKINLMDMMERNTVMKTFWECDFDDKDFEKFYDNLLRKSVLQQVDYKYGKFLCFGSK